MSRSRLLAITLVGATLAPRAWAQALPFSLRLAQGTTISNLNDGGTISYSAEAIGRPSDASLAITYRGTGTAVFTAVDLTGSTDFILSGVPDFTTTYAPNQSFTMGVRYLPSTSARVTGRIQFSYTETPPNPPGGAVRTGIFTVNLIGVAPEFAFTVVPQPAGNATPILPGETIAFPATLVNETASAIVIASNRGTGPGAVNLVTLAGATAFVLSGVPPLPTSVDAGRDLRFTVRYAPTAIESSTGAVRIEFVDRAVTFNLTGSSTGPVFAYDVVQESTVSSVLPGQTITLPDTVVGDKSSLTVRVRNTGTADGRIASISALGTGFAAGDLPFLPLLLTPRSAITFTLTFTPAQPGRFAGRLRIGDDTFDLAASGLGPTLQYSYIAGNVTTTVANNGSVVFAPVSVGGNASVRFVVTNTGTAAGAVNSIGVVTTGTLFTLSGLPSLPSTIGPGETLAFTVTFTPVATGSATATLKVDTLSFTLSGIATAPPALPEYRFSGASGAQEPAAQIAVGLSLAQAYPLALTGTLTLAFNSDVFANDPGVQFATGGRTVNFTIAAGSTQAVFANNASTIRLQSGTVAGTITLTPSFQTLDGGINLTPTTPPALNLTVASSAPRLVNLQVTSKTTTGFSLLVTGYATGRSVTQIDVQFTPVAGENVSTTRLSINADPSFTAWYQSSTSIPFGSQFTATIPFTLAGDVKNVTSVVDTIQSVSVTLTNRQGVSAARSVDLK